MRAVRARKRLSTFVGGGYFEFYPCRLDAYGRRKKCVPCGFHRKKVTTQWFGFGQSQVFGVDARQVLRPSRSCYAVPYLVAMHATLLPDVPVQ